MKHFTSVEDVGEPGRLVADALAIKKDPYANKQIGENKTLGLIFFNASLRTRMSTQRAAQNLGMNVIVMNLTQDSWQIEMEDGAVMNGVKAEHIKEAAAVMGAYCDILGIRSFPSLVDKEADYSEKVIKAFMKYAGVPVLSLESATLHPLQSLADVITIEELKTSNRPKVVLTWAPHVKALPQAVPNSFSQWVRKMDYDFVITHPRGFELSREFTRGVKIEYDQDTALHNADFVYVKNWSAYHDYGVIENHPEWFIDSKKLSVTNNARIMHCLPVRRNVVIADEVLDGPGSVILLQAENRIFSAQVVLKELLQK